jgi:hypothetical protein
MWKQGKSNNRKDAQCTSKPFVRKHLMSMIVFLSASCRKVTASIERWKQPRATAEGSYEDFEL